MFLAALVNDYLPWKDVQGQGGIIPLGFMLVGPVSILIYGAGKMVFTAWAEYQEKIRRAREEGREEGRKEGRKEGREEALREFGLSDSATQPTPPRSYRRHRRGRRRQVRPTP